jgi:hypothetical protein
MFEQLLSRLRLRHRTSGGIAGERRLAGETALARLHVQNHARRRSLEAKGKREKMSGGKTKKRKKLRVKVWHEKQEMPVARARVSRK